MPLQKRESCTVVGVLGAAKAYIQGAVTMSIQTTVRCFRRLLQDEPCTTRRGVWLMTGPHRGVFFHGSRKECETPRYTLAELAGDGTDFDVDEITPEGALKELASFPAAQIQAEIIFARHPVLRVPDGNPA